MNALQLREDVVRPALKLIDMHSTVAENLVMGTAATESHLKYIRQISGPALGLWQMEPFTHDDIWKTWLFYRDDVQERVLDAIETDCPPKAERLLWDLRYGAIMCRLRYRRVPEPLPRNDVEDLARYYKKWYNTPQGKATEDQFVFNYIRVQE